MADSKITALTALTAADPVNDMLPIVDVSDTTMAASGTTKKISVNNILSSSPTASGALTVTGLVTAGSATITGAATVGTTLGVTGVSTFAAGTMLLPALTTTGDTNTGIYYPAADTFAVTTGGAERYRVDSSGNVGVGLTPRAKLDVNGGLLVNNYITSTNYAPLSVTTASTITTPSTFTNAINIWNPTTVGAYSNITFGYNILGLTNAPAYIGFVSTSSASGGFGDLVFGTRDVGTDTAAAERVRIDASGNLLVGTTGSLPSFANGRIEVLAVASSYCIVADATATSAAAIGVRGNDSTVAASFYNASTGGTVGSIVINSGGVSYNTTSDYRLKESVKPISGGLARVNALKPSVYNWKSNGSTGEGFLAHELAEVVPFAVSGEKDAMNADGTIKSQGIDMSRVVPILVAAIQELTARVQTLEAR